MPDFALIKDSAVQRYPYSIGQLRADNPQTSFPDLMTADQLAEFGVLPVRQSERPAIDPATERLEEGMPAQRGSDWVKVWTVVPLTPQEQASALAELENLRRNAYVTEADPLFFKAQRGEATHQQWLDKVTEIKARFPE